ncbi:hypothetical protein, partial [Thiorhodococcus mannitoliphagus]|uniref:hypothetical protein n=1 Tax=Thiorhodococcus mannitoliphagus TaxID=329406 RepID=UPI001980ECA0
ATIPGLSNNRFRSSLASLGRSNLIRWKKYRPTELREATKGRSLAIPQAAEDHILVSIILRSKRTASGSGALPRRLRDRGGAPLPRRLA